MKDLQNYYWTGIFLFWLVVPLIILFVKYVKYLIALNDVKNTTPDQDLQKGFTLLLVSICVSFIISGAIGDARMSFTGIVSLILTYLAYQSFEQWAARLSQQSQSPNHVLLREGFHDIQIANVLCVLIVGIFMIPGAFGKAADALLAEYGISSGPNMNSHPAPQNAEQSHQTPEYAAPTSFEALVSVPKDKFCPFCGNQLPSAGAHFCDSCGNQVE